MSIKSLLILVVGLMASVMFSGCAAIGVMVNPSSHEQRVPAEFKLASELDGRILVITTQPAWVSSSYKLEDGITQHMNAFLIAKVGIKANAVISHGEYTECKRESLVSAGSKPLDIARKLEADMLLLISISDYKLYQSGPGGYYVGSLSTNSVIYDVGTEEVLWPKSGLPKETRIAVSVEVKGEEQTLKRLMKSGVHCIGRNFFNIRKPYYKVPEEQPTFGQGEWK